MWCYVTDLCSIIPEDESYSDDLDVYEKEPIYTVGFYDPRGEWHVEEIYNKRKDAADRVHYLNGGDLPNRHRSARQRSKAKPRKQATLHFLQH